MNRQDLLMIPCIGIHVAKTGNVMACGKRNYYEANVRGVFMDYAKR